MPKVGTILTDYETVLFRSEIQVAQANHQFSYKLGYYSFSGFFSGNLEKTQLR